MQFSATCDPTKWASPTITQMGTLSILLVLVATLLNSSIYSVQLYRPLNILGIKTVGFWLGSNNTHCWVFLNILEIVDKICLGTRGI